MKICQIEINDFRGISKLSTAPEQVNVLLAPCGAGKTSFLKAVCFGITGAVKEDDIRRGALQTSVIIRWEDGTYIERIRKKGETVAKCCGKRTSAKSVNQFLKEKLGADVSIYGAMCGIDYFKSLSRKDLTSLFLSILPLSITFDRLWEFVEGMGEFHAAQDERKFLKEQFPEGGSFGLKEIDEVYHRFFKWRTEQKAVLKSLKAKAEFSGILPEESKDALSERLYRIAKAESETEMYQRSMDSWIKNQEQREKAVKKKREIEARLKNEFTDAVKPDEGVLEKARKDKAAFEEAVAKAQKAVAVFEENIRLFQRTMDSLGKPVCPISENLICTTDKRGVMGELKEALLTNEEEKREYESFILRCREQIGQRDKIISDYQAALLKYSRKELLEKQAAGFIIPEETEKPIKITAADYGEERKEISRKLSQWDAYETAQSAKAEYDRKAEEVRLLEFAVSVLDVKTGIRSKLVERAIGPIEKMCNEKAVGLWKGYRMKFDCSEGIVPYISSPKSQGFIPVGASSTGEFMMAAYLLMAVINKVSDTRYLMIDNLDGLDRECAKSFLEMLIEDAAGMFDNIFVGAVNHDDTEFITEQLGIHQIEL